ncbi:MAG TPA: glycosyltransferase family 39 protein, partial [bacterium]
VRLPMLKLATAETTDGVLCLTYFSPEMAQTPRFVVLPGYPFLLHIGEWLGCGGWMWGRLLSTLAGLLFLIPLWKFCRRWMSEEMSGMVCLMALFSPLLWQWSLKVMPDTLFLLAFWWCLERLTKAFAEKNKSAWVQANFAAVIAACTRPEGFLILPWIWAVGGRLENENRWKRFGLTILLWAGPFFQMKEKVFTLLYAYREGLGFTDGAAHLKFPFLNFLNHFYTYLSQPVYVFTPLVYWFAILGLGKMARRYDAEGEAFKKVILQVYLLLLLSRLFPTTYQDRHMLCFLPLLLVAAGYHLETFLNHWGEKRSSLKKMFFKNGLLTFCLVWLSLFSGAVLISQNDSFGDIKRSAEFLKTLPKDAIIYSDEIPKTEYWSGKKVLPVVLPFEPKKGDYVVLHSFYTDRLSFVDDNMRNRLGGIWLHEERSMVVPLLTDTMTEPKIQNRTTATAYRFEPQFFMSLIYQMKK